MTQSAKLILNALIPHRCQPGKCSGNHGRGMLEMPSDIFIKACLLTIQERGVTISTNGIAPT
tara:strand:- start:210 stop:395 length:186 start_codon:yes stop_codon:yes gene_type:complete